ncbi:MAG TPA: hypothetical protein O0X27_04100 [Methanocorpusculum sp.]|nr:hypothetical protein [Methanocorpusculum sp.]
MAKQLFNEAILREDARKGTYFIRYIPWLIITAALAIIPWVLASKIAIVYNGVVFVVNHLVFLNKITFLPAFTSARILISVVFGVIFIILLVAGIRNLNIPRMVVTKNRVCLLKRPNKYYEARYDKIDAFVVKGNTLKVYAGGRKVFAFGPLPDVYTSRDAIVVILEKRYIDEEEQARQVKPVSASEAEPIDKPNDLFDGADRMFAS